VTDIEGLLGDDANGLLTQTAQWISKENLVLPGQDFVDRVVAATDGSRRVLRTMRSLFDHGRLAGTGYVSILPVDQGIEHSAASAFAPDPRHLDEPVPAGK
jgi:class I fructose-bisphosphate aldolase